MRVIYNYADDEKNSLTKTALMMRIGGGHGSPGIHGAHLGPGVVIHYSPDDESRQSIARVEYQNSLTGRHNVFLAPNVKPEKLAKLATRQMDCMECQPPHAHPRAARACRQQGAGFRRHLTVAALREEDRGRAVAQALCEPGAGRPRHPRRLAAIL